MSLFIILVVDVVFIIIIINGDLGSQRLGLYLAVSTAKA